MVPDPVKASKRALKIAVTGGAGSGKSTVCRRLEKLGAFVVDLDRLSRDAVSPGSAGFKQAVDRFGPDMVAGDGGLDRARLREAILADPRARRDLEAIVHPIVLRQMERQMAEAEAAGHRLLVAEVPLLFEAGLASRFDLVVVVSAPEAVRVRRMAERDGVAPDRAAALIRVQMPESEKRKRADLVIDNTGPPEAVADAVDRLYFRLIAGTEKDGESA